MRVTFNAVFTGLLAVAAAQSSSSTSTASASAPGASYGPNYFTPPAGGYLLAAGVPYQFTWKPTTGGTVTLVLRNGPNGNLNAGTVIASSIPNSGSYTFTPPLNIVPDVSYTVEIVDDQDTSEVNFTQQFDITNDNPPPVSSSASASSGATTATAPTSTFSTISGTVTTTGGLTTTTGSGTASASTSRASSSGSATSTSGSSTASGSKSASGTSSPSASATSVQNTNSGAALTVSGGLLATVLALAFLL
ncbi:SMP-30 gluconolaconase LRE domain protein [Agyrium rufum]|nr:SMP-30 gluconolaconase LRE domain protein [Agyrium rufum]